MVRTRKTRSKDGQDSPAPNNTTPTPTDTPATPTKSESQSLAIYSRNVEHANLSADIESYPVLDIGTWQGTEKKPLARFGAFNKNRGDNSSPEIELGPPDYSSGIRWATDVGNSKLNRVWIETRSPEGNREVGLSIWENGGVTIGGLSPGATVESADSFIAPDSLGVAGYIQAASLKVGANTISYASTPPDNGQPGDICFNAAPTADGWIGWIFTDLGWRRWGNIEKNILTETAIAKQQAETPTDYLALVLADSPLFFCTSGDSARPLDLSGNSQPLEYLGVVTSYEDSYSFSPSNGASAIFLNDLAPIPTIFTVELAFKANSGGLFYFGDGKFGAGAFSLDTIIYQRGLAIWIQTAEGKWINTDPSVVIADGSWHKLTVISGTSSFYVILDGAIAYQDTALPTDPVFNGYWHVGHSIVSKTLDGSIKNFSVTLAEISSDRAIQRQNAMIL